MFARIAVNIPSISGVFDYSVPPELARQIRAGCLVTAPFGAQTVQGVVLDLLESPAVAVTKPVLSLLDVEPVLSRDQLALAGRLAESTLNPLAAIVGLMLPAGLSQQADTLYQLPITNPEFARVQPAPPGIVASRLINLLRERGPMRGRQLDTHFKRVDWRKTAGALIRKGALTSQAVLPAPRVRPKLVRVAQLAVTPAQAESAIDSLGSEKTRARRQRALRFLVRQPEALNVSWVYAESDCKLADLQALEERGLIRLFENEVFRDPIAQVASDSDPAAELRLTPEQDVALQAITRAILAGDSSKPFLLKGVTASGKTEIYLRAAEVVLQRGAQVIVLVPEIALTAQTVRRFQARFPGQVGLLHSKLSEGERYDTWRRARSGDLRLVIGARSALFAPLPHIGLIVVDECHDGSYYQAEPPFYNAASAAQMYARLCGAVCVLGSATPTVVQRYAAEHSRAALLDLPRRIAQRQMPPVQIVDMREELKAGNREIFSRALSEALAETLARNEQAILFLNRRGSQTYVFCRDCGTSVRCPNCDTPLTLHDEPLKRASKPKLMCHRCGYERLVPRTCEKCGSANIRAYGLGVQKVEAEMRALFPRARTLRWDWETTRSKDSHEMILTHFSNHQADVLIGTQMLAKGLDLPLVTLVGIVLADVGLNLPDPFAGERVFQTLTQVAGRAGRSERGGRVIMQTFAPEHYVVQAAAAHDENRFYERELSYRKDLGYPPFTRLARIEFRSADAAQAEKESQKAATRLRVRLEAAAHRQTEMIGPLPSFFAKENGEYRWQIVLRGPDPAAVLDDEKFAGARVEIDPISLL